MGRVNYGDAYMCAGGLPVSNDTNPIDVVKAGLEIQSFMHELKLQKKAENKPSTSYYKYFSRAFGLPGELLFVPPDVISYQFVYLSRPF